LEHILPLYDNVKNTDTSNCCKGVIKIYKNDELILHKQNHIVLTGRQWLMQRMFGLAYDINIQQHQWSPRWFALGNGGATLDSPFQPIWPTDNDIDLFSPIVFTDRLTSKYTLDGKKKLIDAISYETPLTTKVTMTINNSDCVDQYINEAGLFIAPTHNQDESTFLMFSHVTFPTIPKSVLVKLLIEWFFIF
jgi:hypothetical protein